MGQHVAADQREHRMRLVEGYARPRAPRARARVPPQAARRDRAARTANRTARSRHTASSRRDIPACNPASGPAKPPTASRDHRMTERRVTSTFWFALMTIAPTCGVRRSRRARPSAPSSGPGPCRRRPCAGPCRRRGRCRDVAARCSLEGPSAPAATSRAPRRTRARGARSTARRTRRARRASRPASSPIRRRSWCRTDCRTGRLRRRFVRREVVPPCVTRPARRESGPGHERGAVRAAAALAMTMRDEARRERPRRSARRRNAQRHCANWHSCAKRARR